MKARVKWIEGVSFTGQSGSGHSVVMDGAPEAGGQNLGVRPMEMLLLGLGGCTAFDVVSILRKARQAIADCAVELSAEKYCSASAMLGKTAVITHDFEIREGEAGAGGGAGPAVKQP